MPGCPLVFPSICPPRCAALVSACVGYQVTDSKPPWGNIMNAARKMSLVIAGLYAVPALAVAANLTVVSFGGANKEAQNKAYYQPYKAATGVNLIGGDYNGEMAKVK